MMNDDQNTQTIHTHTQPHPRPLRAQWWMMIKTHRPSTHTHNLTPDHWEPNDEWWSKHTNTHTTSPQTTGNWIVINADQYRPRMRFATDIRVRTPPPESQSKARSQFHIGRGKGPTIVKQIQDSDTGSSRWKGPCVDSRVRTPALQSQSKARSPMLGEERGLPHCQGQTQDFWSSALVPSQVRER